MIQITNPKRFLFTVIIVAAIILGIVMFVFGSSDIRASGEFTLTEGSAATTVGRSLKEKGYISRTFPWRLAVWRADTNTSLKAGTYHLKKGESLADVVSRMAKGEVVPDELTITYPEGFTLKQIAARTASRGIGTEEEFISVAHVRNFSSQFAFLKDLPPNQPLEGYLFPDTYRVFADDKPQDVIKRMLGNFDKKMTVEMLEEIAKTNHDLSETVIMASIIEREVNRTQDLSKVADVLWKRYDSDAGLGADATIRYILDNWDKALTVKDLDLDSPYNTRRYRGLPPTAIGNPGLTAILAALRPEKTDFYYYLSAPSGETIFSKTNDEHNSNKAKYLR